MFMSYADKLNPWEEANIKVIDSKELSKPVKLIAWIPGVFFQRRSTTSHIMV